ncbi:unnamed protein product [Macrosiphum euphorbiae]|uniref:RNA-directed DNA polymerase n=6 Tax=Macrosiphum euphorbiae TaxID=13131 RepID=A0AAV0WED7_9HEMI|nr:unnamed protein product [Macrosiphum euphorbiae]
MSALDSTERTVLKAIKTEEIREELLFRLLPNTGQKEELVDMLLSDNERVVADGIQANLIAARKKRNEDAQKIIELQNTIATMSLTQNSQPANENVLDLILRLSQSQQAIADKLSLNSQHQVQIFSTNDTAKAISLFSGKKIENVCDWVKEVERISVHAHWTPSLTLVNATSRLAGSALNWHKVSGRSFDDWYTWKEGIIDRFKVKMSLSEFIQFQAKRTLRSNEPIADYIYDKDAIIDKAPFPLQQSDRVSLILQGITKHEWAIPLTTAMCTSVKDLLDRAVQLDAIRKVQYVKENTSENTTSFKSQDNQKEQGNYIPRFNPSVHKEEDQTCYRCKQVGHVSYNCKNPLQEKSARVYNKTDIKDTTYANKKHFNKEVKPKETLTTKTINCVQEDSTSEDFVRVSQIPATINGNMTIDALPDIGSCVTLLRRCFVPDNIPIFPWQDGSYATPEGNCTPSGWISLRIKVGNIDYVMPKVGLCDKLPIAMILGRDWQKAVQATITIEPNGAVCITTPSSIQEFGCVKSKTAFVGCVVQSRFNNRPLVTKISDIETTKVDQPFLNQDQTQKLESLINSYEDIFSTPEAELGEFPDIEMEILLTNDKPIKCKPYKATDPDRTFMRNQVEKWISQGVCRMSTSPYAAPAFVVDQPFHESTPKRLVVDYSRTINPITVKDPFPIDQMDLMISKIAGKKFKSLVDIKHAFNNFKIKENDIFKTAAVTPDYHIEFCRVIFGLANAPALLARAISIAYGDLLKLGLAKYYDDLAAGHDSFEDHLNFLQLLFEATRKYSLKFTKSKCTFAAQEIKILGRILDEKGDRPDPERAQAVTRYQTLSTLQELRSFLGFANALRRYINHFASIARPLTNMLKNKPVSSKKSSNYKIQLSDDEHHAFVKLKSAITSNPVLAAFRQNVPTTVETDASHEGLGACLSQIHDGSICIIEYASRSLKDPEKRYHSNELEVTAVHWAITEKFRLYLVGQTFKLITDNYSTAYIVNKAKLNRKFARYVVDLAAFEFEPIYRAGKLNIIADHLSRYPQPVNDENQCCLAIINSQNDKLVHAQQADSFCQQINKKLKNTNNTVHILQIKCMYKYENNILVHVNIENGFEVSKIVIPFSFRNTVLQYCHDNTGHFDIKKTLSRIKARYWWSSMRKDCALYVRGCKTCQQVNRRTTSAYGMLGERPIPEVPFEVISADHLSLPTTKAGNCYILAHICHATRFLLARPTCTTATDDIIHTLENDIINHYGLPVTYISDNGSSFTSSKFKLYLEKYEIQHSLCPPYTPQANGLVERSNATMISVLSKFSLEHPDDWDIKLPNLILAINTSQQSTTKFSPFYLLHGYEPKLSTMDMALGSVQSDLSRMDQLDLLAESRGIAIENLKDNHKINKKRFDQHRSHHNFQPGQRVWYNWQSTNDTKLSPNFKGPFVIEHPVGKVCYKITRADATNKKHSRIVHVQSLKPAQYRPNLDDPGEIQFEENNQQSPPTSLTDNIQINSPTPTIDTKVNSITKRTRKTPSWLKDYIIG